MPSLRSPAPRFAAYGCLALGFLAFRPQPIGAQTTLPPASADSAAIEIVRTYFSAYNAHDIEAVLNLLSPDFTWLSVAGDSVMVEARGVPALRTTLSEYFQRFPSAQSDIEAISALSAWVMVQERARWTSSGVPRAQASISVYEVRSGLLRRVWYYPVVR